MGSASSSAGRHAPTPHSTSRIVADAVKGSHVLKIQGYSTTKGLGTGKYISSGTFVVGGHDWCIKYHPDGFDSESPGYISMFLHLQNSDATTEVKAMVMFSRADEMGEPSSYRTGWDKYTFKGTESGRGSDKFIDRKVLEKSCYLKDDCLGIRCDVMVLKEFRTQITKKRFVTVPPPDMHQQIGRLLSASSHADADVTFQVGIETVAAHRLVLAARSPVFMAELFGPMKESNASHIRIDDMDPRVFRAMLHFVYTDSVPDDISKDKALVQHLLVAADRYDIQRLKLMCEDKLCNYINSSTVTANLALAEQHDCPGLKEACFEFLKLSGNLKAIMSTDDMQQLTSSYPILLKELVAKLAP